MTSARLRCLRRTKVAQDFGRRRIRSQELAAFAEGPALQDRQWDWLKANGYVANGRGMQVRLTEKGERELRKADARR